jgi:hypothetical protein
MPFLADIETHVRFLLVVPLYIFAELIVHRRIRVIVVQFVDRGLVPEAALGRFRAALEGAIRWRNSIPAELALIAVVYSLGVFIRGDVLVLDADSWYARREDGAMTATAAGLWLQWVSTPIMQFLLLRWYYRIFIWTRFLWRVSRIELSVVPTHPDRVGGLGFLSNTAYAYVPLAAAHGALLAGMIANRIFYLGDGLLDFKVEVGVVLVFVLSLVFGPLLVFAPRLAQAKRTGLREYGTLAERYVREFDAKWLRGGAPADERLVGSADLQSLADLGSSFEVVRTMRMAPVTKEAVFQVAAATLAPVVPLALTMMSLEDLLKRLLGILL